MGEERFSLNLELGLEGVRSALHSTLGGGGGGGVIFFVNIKGFFGKDF